MAKVKWTEEKVLDVIKECRVAGTRAAQEKMAELQKAGPKYAVTQGNRIVDTMLDVCGFANLKISARGKFFQLAKKLAKDRTSRFYCDNAYRGGGYFSVYDTTRRQEMSVNRASCAAMVPVLDKYGIEARVETRID